MIYAMQFSAEAFAFAASCTKHDLTRPYLGAVNIARPADPKLPGAVLTGTDGVRLLSIYDEKADLGVLGEQQNILVGVDRKASPEGAQLLKHCHGRDRRTILLNVDEEAEEGMAQAVVFETLAGGTENDVFLSPRGVETIDHAYPSYRRVMCSEAEGDTFRYVGAIDCANLASILTASRKLRLTEDGHWAMRSASSADTPAVTIYQNTLSGPLGLRWECFKDRVVGTLMPRKQVARVDIDDIRWI